MALALPKPLAGQYLPQLASSWQVTTKTVVIHLRRQATWQDGKPLTSTDVLDSLMIYGANGNGLWGYTTGASINGPHELTFHVANKAAGEILLGDILPNYPVPASQYGQFIPANFQQTLIHYYQLELHHPSQLSSSSVAKTVHSVFTNAEKYNPTSLIGDGPFKLVSVNTSSIIFTKWPGFYDAAKIHVSEIHWLGLASNNDSYGVLLSNRADASGTALTGAVATEYLHKYPTDHIATPPNFSTFALYFNDHLYPFNELKVRQAIAYLVNRPAVNKLAMGVNGPYRAVTKPDGLFYMLNDQYLSRSQLASLNSYSYNPHRATALLTSLHFKKVHGRWVLPNGKSFTTSLIAPSGESDTDAMTTAIGSELTSFGIKTSVLIESAAIPGADLSNGHFQLVFTINGYGTTPVSWPVGEIGYDENFPNYGLYKGNRGIGFGPTADVKGLGTINIPATLYTESETYYSGKQLDHLSFVWARFINENLPLLSVIDKNVQWEYSTSRYTDWPPKSSFLWDMVGMGTHTGLLAMMEAGYIRPRS